MKKTLSLIAGALMSLGFASNANAQAVEQGTMLIDATYGFPNLFTTVLKNGYANDMIATDVKISSFGPAALKFEYLVSDKVGLGLEVGYANSGVTYKQDYSEFDENNNLVTNTYEYKVSCPRFRIMPKFAFHFGNNDNFDGYFSVSAGYSGSSLKVETKQPGYTDAGSVSLAPFAARLAVGGRYFFSDVIGANMEFGIGGGALIAAGVSVRLNP